MQAAIKAAEREHNVVLYEETNCLGGQLNHGEYINFKNLLDKYMNYLIIQMQKQEQECISVVLGNKATSEIVAEIGADAVIVAVSAEPIVPPIPGIESNNVMTACNAFEHADKVGQQVVIIGGEFVGCEVVVHFPNLGHQVTLVEMTDKLMPQEGDGYIRYHTFLYFDYEHDMETAVLDHVKPMPNKVKTLMECHCGEITPNGVVLTNKVGISQTLKELENCSLVF